MGWLLIARFTMQEAIRRRLFLTITILSLALLGLFTLLLHEAVSRIQYFGASTGQDVTVQLVYEGIGITVLAMWLVYLLSSILTIFLTIGMISGEVEAGTFVIIVPKPLRRAEIVFGKWLGFACILGLFTLFISLAFMGVINWFTGYWPPQSFTAIALLELSMLVMLGLITLCGAFVPTAANGAIAVMFFIGAFISSIVQFVIPAQDGVIQNTTTIISLFMPTDALWHDASFYLLPGALGALADFSLQSMNTPFSSTQPMAPALLVWAILYCLLLPVFAALRFQRRDL